MHEECWGGGGVEYKITGAGRRSASTRSEPARPLPRVFPGKLTTDDDETAAGGRDGLLLGHSCERMMSRESVCGG